MGFTGKETPERNRKKHKINILFTININVDNVYQLFKKPNNTAKNWAYITSNPGTIKKE